MGQGHGKPYGKEHGRDGVAVHMGLQLTRDRGDGCVMFISGSTRNKGAKMGGKVGRAHAEDEPWLKRGFNVVRCHVLELRVNAKFNIWTGKQSFS